jgi:PIN domain nuclease of toxin-antitoxin system
VRFLLDTHIVVWWLSESRKLSQEQLRAIREAVRRGEPLAISAMTLIEIATLRRDGPYQAFGSIEEALSQVETDPTFQVLPITFPVARDAAALSSLRDPSDRAIVATARVNRLRLLTSDWRIIDSKLVSVVD